jgi:homeobox-leucine zipper protein
MTIAFQFAFESHLQDSVAAMARQYMRSIISSVQRIALALSSSRLVSHGHGGVHLLPPVSQEAETLSRWIVQSYRFVVVYWCGHCSTKGCLVSFCFISADGAGLCRFHFGAELIKPVDANSGESVLKALWHHTSAILCCSLKVCSRFFFLREAKALFRGLH